MASKIKIESIRTDGGTQSRVAIKDDVVNDYVPLVEKGLLPPIVVFFDGSEHWLADGFHRLESHIRANKKRIDADIREGTQRDAILYSVGANANHGLRRTNDDKRLAVMTLLNDKEWSKKSNRWIAHTANVSDMLVGSIRKEISGATSCTSTDQSGATSCTCEDSPGGNSPTCDESSDEGDGRREGMDGKSYPAPDNDPKPDLVYESDDVEEDEPKKPVDAHYEDDAGNRIPDDLIHIWDGIKELREASKSVRELKASLRTLFEKPHGQLIHINSVEQTLDSVKNAINHSFPAYLCPSCMKKRNSKCGWCKGRFWLDATIWKTIDESAK